MELNGGVAILVSFLIGTTLSQQLIPIENIPNTDLYTGIFYTIDLQAGGRLTWSNAKTNGYNIVQIVYGSYLKSCQQGGSFYEDCQWMLMKSEEQDKYIMIIRNVPHGVITWGGESPSGKWVVLYQNADDKPDYMAGGKFRKDMLWSFKKYILPNADFPYYTIRNAKFPQNGIVTWSSKTGVVENSEARAVQIYTASRSSDQKPNKHELWNFQAAIEITAQITTFKTKQDLKDLMNKDKQVEVAYQSNLRNTGSSDVEDTFKHTEQVKNTATVSFKSSLEVLQSAKVQFSVPGFGGINYELETKAGLESGKENSVEKTKTFEWQHVVKVPAHKCVSVKALFSRVKNLKVDFTARVSMEGTTDRMTKGRNVQKRKKASPELVRKVVESDADFKGKFIKIDGSKVIYEIEGTLEAAVGFNKDLETKDISCDIAENAEDVGTGGGTATGNGTESTEQGE